MHTNTKAFKINKIKNSLSFFKKAFAKLNIATIFALPKIRD
jgi:hypothetical protein